MMRGEYRAIHAAITTDPLFVILSRDSKLLWFVLKLRLGPSGIDHLAAHRHQLAQLSGLTLAAIDKSKQELRPHWLLWEGDILWLRNGLRWEPRITLANANHRKGVVNHLSGLPVQPIVRTFCEYYDLDDVTEGRVDAMPMTFECHSNVIPQQELGITEEGSRDAQEDFGAEFEGVWLEYPSRGRGNSNPKKEAKEHFIRRRREGIPLTDLAMAVAEYSSQLRDAGKIGTEGVMQGKTFFGRNDRWVEYLEEWKLRQKLVEKRAAELKIDTDAATAQPTEEELAQHAQAVKVAVAHGKAELALVRERRAKAKAQQDAT